MAAVGGVKRKAEETGSESGPETPTTKAAVARNLGSFGEASECASSSSGNKGASSQSVSDTTLKSSSHLDDSPTDDREKMQ